MIERVSDTEWQIDIERRAGRVLLVDAAQRTLLFQHPDHLGNVGWIVPGGGLEDGESFEEAALREVHEETGLILDRLDGEVYHHTFIVPFRGQVIRQQAVVYVAFLDEVDIDIDPGGRTARWWTPEAVRETPHLMRPVELADVLLPLLTAGIPQQPTLLPLYVSPVLTGR